MKKIFVMLVSAAFLFGGVVAQAQVMKSADLEKYARSKYGDKRRDAALDIGR